MASYGFEWAKICLEQVTSAAGLRVRFGEAPSGAPFATFTARDAARALPMTLQVADDTMIVTAEVATGRDEPSDEDLLRLDDVAERWPAGSLAWDERTRTLLARAFLDAPEGRVPSGTALHAALDVLLVAGPELARLHVPPVPMASAMTVAMLARPFADAGIALVPIAEGVLGLRLRHALPEIGTYGFACGLDVLRVDGHDVAPGFWIEGELLDGTRWPDGRTGALLMNQIRNALASGTILRRAERAVFRDCYARAPDDPRWPHRAIGAAASAVRDIASTARTGRFERRAPRPNPG